MICQTYKVTFNVRRKRIWGVKMFEVSRCLVSTNKRLEVDTDNLMYILKNYWGQKHPKKDELSLLSIKLVGQTKISISKYGIVVTPLTYNLPVIFDIDLTQKQL